ncbi:MAG: hypothetical protein KZQ56_04215, partial [gamma proteobacterium symbiont of Lucinoma myriamae]|nr:hypothetical protein [gamma proteobacterium symbiont of Lucinoma myriamae]
MKKIKLSAKTFNRLQYDTSGAKTQRVWTNEFRGLGVSLGQTRKSIIYKYKSPVDNRFKIITMDSFTYDQVLDDDLIDEIVGEHYAIKSKIRAGICPITQREKERVARAQTKADKLAEIEAQAQQDAINAFTLDDAHQVYCKHRSYTQNLKPKKRSSPCNDIISSTKLLIIELFFSRL